MGLPLPCDVFVGVFLLWKYVANVKIDPPLPFFFMEMVCAFQSPPLHAKQPSTRTMEVSVSAALTTAWHVKNQRNT